jgi:hypothetical protein
LIAVCERKTLEKIKDSEHYSKLRQ